MNDTDKLLKWIQNEEARYQMERANELLKIIDIQFMCIITLILFIVVVGAVYLFK